MIATRASRSAQRGAALLLATVFLLIVIALFGLISLRMAGTDVTDTALQSDSVEALFLAESGLERALQKLDTGSACDAALLDAATQSLGNGDFQIEGAMLDATSGLCQVTVRGRVLMSGSVRAQRIVRGDVSFGSSDTGWAVGQNGTIFMWNGSSWVNASSGGFTNGVPSNRDLRGVYCVTQSDCWAVGENGTIAHFNGTTWDDNGVVESVTHELRSVYCNASDDCWAVGVNGSGRATIARWNGTSWVETGGGTNNTPNRDLYAVYCIDANDCWAVGEDYNGDGLIVHWDGSTWEDETGGGFTNNTPGRILHGVHCFDADNCWAVGEEGTVVRWNSSTDTWTNGGFTNNSPNETLYAVSCIAADDCWAVGGNRNGDGTIVHWNGSSWSTSGFTNSTPNEDLNSVYCFGSGDCWALGDDGAAARLSGTAWTTVATPTTTQNLYSVHFPAGSGGSVGLQRWQEIIQ